MSTFFRIFSIVLIVTVLCCVIALPASAYEVWNIYDHIDNISFVGDNAHITFSLPQDNIQWAFYENGSFTYLSGQDVKYDVTAGQAFNLYFNPFGIIHSATPNDGAFFSDNFISTDDLPEDATFNHILKIGVSNGSSISYNSVNSIAYYVSSDNQFLSKVPFPNVVEWDSEVYNLWIRSNDVPIDSSAGSGFHTQTVIESLKLPYSGSTNFAYEFSISFNVSKAYFDYVTSGRFSAALDAIDKHLASNGQSLSGIMDKQQQIHESLEDIINSEVTGETPDGSDTVTDYESAEEELMDKVSGGSSKFDDITVSASDRIYLYSQAFLAFGYIFDLFADIPFLQGLLYVSLTLGTFAFLIGIGSAAGRYFSHHTAAGKRRGG